MQHDPQYHTPQCISSLELHEWQQDIFANMRDAVTLTKGRKALWTGLGIAKISNLTLGEWPSLFFCKGYNHLDFTCPQTGHTPTLFCLRSLTLHLNEFALNDVLPSEHHGSLSVLSMLSQLTSLTLKGSEVRANGSRKKLKLSADLLLNSLPPCIQSVAIHNFRDRWVCFKDLSQKPRLVTLDLTESACLLPQDSANWTQLQQLTLTSTALWLEQGQPFWFNSLTKLTELDLKDCSFANFSPGQIGNTQQYVYHQFQAPSSIVSLNLLTKSVQVGTQTLCPKTLPAPPYCM